MTLRIHTWGRGPEIVLLHGFTGAGDAFDHLREVLPVRAIAPDLPGHGESPAARGWDQALDDLADALGPAPRFLFGYSMGARLALGFALRFPERVRRLCLESGSPGIDDPDERAERRAADDELASVLEREGVPSFLDRWERHPTLATLRDLPQPVAAQLRARRLRNSAAGLASALRHLGPGAQPSLWPRLPHLAVPTLLVAGERDAKFSALARATAERTRRARVRILPSAGHAPHLETPRELAQAIADDILNGGGDRT